MSNIVQNTAEMRSFNTKKIIEYLRFNTPTTKKELSEKLGLSFATVSNLCNELIKEGLLGITSSLNSNGGRIPGLISINTSVKFTLCINLSQKKNVDIALMNLKNELIGEKHIDATCFTILQDMVQNVYHHSEMLLDELNISWNALLGVGIAVPGIFLKENRHIINSTNELYENQPLKDIFEKSFGLPVYIENESNLLAIAEVLSDTDESKNKDLVYIFAGEGLGTGIITSGNLVTGAKGLGGEISHIPIGNHNFKCYCGNGGCIETELTMEGFLKKYYGQEFVKCNYEFDPWENFVSKLQLGEKKAIQVVEENGKLFGKLISVLINIFDPKTVYLGGIASEIFNELYPYIIQEVKMRVMVNQFSGFSICNGKDYERSIFQGCCELIIKQWRP